MKMPWFKANTWLQRSQQRGDHASPPEKLSDKLEYAQSTQAQIRKLIGAVGLMFVVMLALVAIIYFGVPSSWKESGDATTPPVETAIAPSENADESLREQFAQQLAKYESEVEAKIVTLNLQAWDTDKRAQLTDMKTQALQQAAKGDYLLARQGLQKARAEVDAVSVEHARRLTEAKQQAVAAAEKDQAAEASKAIQEALRLSPSDAEMLTLQKRVAVMPQALDWLRQAKVAEKENRPEKEAVALQRALVLDPSRAQVAARIKVLQAQLAQQQFSHALSDARRALDAGKLAAAKKHVARAKTIFPADKDVAALQVELQRAQAQHEFASQLSLGSRAKQRDDWQAASEHFARALKLKPHDKIANENHDLAQQIVNADKKIKRVLAQQHRLGDDNVLDSVVAYLQEIKTLGAHSTKLKKSYSELASRVTLYQTEVDVVVVSDNSTYVIVRGQGKVGKTSRRTIRLRPGIRVFEGSRPGYKSKLVTLEIKPGDSTAEVTVICDERL